MFYHPDPKDPKAHGLPHDPIKACFVPRPIGWISTVSTGGLVNLAPYSFFNGVNDRPPMVMFSSNGQKDSLVNCEEQGEFVCNFVTTALTDAMNATSAGAPADIDEFVVAGLTKQDSVTVKPPRVGESPIHLECRVHDIIELPAWQDGWRNAMVLGEVVGVNIDDAALKDGLINSAALQPLARLGYMDYASVTETFSLNRPAWPLKT